MPNFNSGSFSKKKLLLLGFIFAVLLIIPLTVFLVQQNQDTRSRADKTTTLSFEPANTTAAVGEPVALSVVLTPGNNQVNFVKLVVTFDPNSLTPVENSIFEVDPASNLTVISDPEVNDNQITVSLNSGIDETKVITTPTKIGTFNFTATAPSPKTEVSFLAPPAVGATDIRSIGQTSTDAFTENVYLSGTAASVVITGEGELTPPVSETPEEEEDEEIVEEEEEATPSAAPTPVGGTTNESPVCQSLDTGGVSSGPAPLTVTFTASGSDSDGTISKATFNFGDGPVEDQTSAGGIGTESVSVQSTHVYQSPGDYTASVVLTDNSNGESSSTTCTVPISVTGEATAVPSDVTPLDATGPSTAIVGGGVLGGILILIGTLIFFAL